MSIAPAELSRTDIEQDLSLDRPWITLVWNDPVNLMSYVSYVFRSYFGHSPEKADELMLAVHHEGRAAVSAGDGSEAAYQRIRNGEFSLSLAKQ